MRPYIEINCHCAGKSHLQKGLNCEDFSDVRSDDSFCIAAVSDGHGDSNCFRSEIGAQIACETALELCGTFAAKIHPPSDGEISAISAFESQIKALEAEIAAGWKTRVFAHAAKHPFTDGELSVLSEQARDIFRSGRSIERAYGCTLIAAVLAPVWWLAIQIGDGCCVAAYDDGIFTEPIPADEEYCVGNRTASLCDPDAAVLFRHHFGCVRPLAAFLMSDGVDESFDRRGLYEFLYSAAFWARNEGAPSALQRLRDLMPQISEGGSGDDVSLAACISLEGELLPPRVPLEQVYQRVSVCENQLAQYRADLCGIQDRLGELARRQSELDAEIAELRAKSEEKEALRRQLDEEHGRLDASIPELTKRLREADAQMEKAARYRSAAEQYWLAALERLGLSPFPLPPKKSPLDDD